MFVFTVDIQSDSCSSLCKHLYSCENKSFYLVSQLNHLNDVYQSRIKVYRMCSVNVIRHVLQTHVTTEHFE